MHIAEYLKNHQTPLISIEIIPPTRTGHWEDIKNTVETLKNFGISWTSITSHAHERCMETIAGRSVMRVKKKRLDTNAICVALKHTTGIEVMPHIIVTGFSKDETEDALINLHFFGVENVLALRGDPLGSQLPFQINQLENTYGADLVEQISQMNHGQYLDRIENPLKTNFCIGVAGYPEKHYQAADFQTDLRNLKAKVDRGADFIVTQMFFDNDCYYRFVDAARKIGIHVPIIPGIKPIFKSRHLTTLPQIFHISVPSKLQSFIEKYRHPEDFYRAGTEYSITQCLDLIDNDVPGLHFYTMNQSHPLVEILEVIAKKTENPRPVFHA